MKNKRGVVRVVCVREHSFDVRFESGHVAKINNGDVLPTCLPMKPGDEIPWTPNDDGNVLIHFAEKRSR